MDTQRLSQGQMIAGVAGVVLLISLFLKWLGVDLPGGIGGGSVNAWKSQSTFDIYLFILAIFAILPAAAEMSGASLEVPFVDAAAAFLLAVIGLIQMLALIVSHGNGVSLKIGVWIATLALIAIAYGSYQAMNEDVAQR